jgi:hypothetical protein
VGVDALEYYSSKMYQDLNTRNIDHLNKDRFKDANQNNHTSNGQNPAPEGDSDANPNLSTNHIRLYANQQRDKCNGINTKNKNSDIDICVFNLDTGLISHPPEADVPNFPPSKSSPPSPVSKQRYKQEVLSSRKFQCYNTPAYRTLHQNVRTLLAKQQIEIQKKELTSKRSNKRHLNNLKNEKVLNDGNVKKPLIDKIFEFSKAEINEKQALLGTLDMRRVIYDCVYVHMRISGHIWI